MTYGCKNRPAFRPYLGVKDGHTVKADGDSYAAFPNVRSVKFNMSRECQYTKPDLGRVDAGCDGCKWKAKNV